MSTRRIDPETLEGDALDEWIEHEAPRGLDAETLTGLVGHATPHDGDALRPLSRWMDHTVGIAVPFAELDGVLRHILNRLAAIEDTNQGGTMKATDVSQPSGEHARAQLDKVSRAVEVPPDPFYPGQILVADNGTGYVKVYYRCDDGTYADMTVVAGTDHRRKGWNDVLERLRGQVDDVTLYDPSASMQVQR